MASQGRRFDTTTIVQTLPGGPIVYFDDDGQVDADVRDRDGSPWFWRRLAEGQYHPPTTHFFKYLKHGCRNMSAANRYAAAAAPLRGTGILHGASLARSVFAETTPWAAWAVTSEVLSGRRGLMGWDEKPRDEGLLLGSADLSLGRWYGRFRRAEEWDNPLTSFKWNLRLNSVGVSAVLGLYHTIPGQSNAQQRRVGMAEAAATLGMAAAIAVVMIIVCPPVGIWATALAAVGVGVLSAGYAFSVAGRLDAGQTWGEALTGGALDMTGVSSVYAGQTGRDIVTGRDLGLSSGERGRALVLGMGQVAATAAVVAMAAYGTAAVAAGRLGALAGRLTGWAGGRLAAAGRWLSGVGRTIGGWMRSAGQWMAARWRAAWKSVRTAGKRLFGGRYANHSATQNSEAWEATPGRVGGFTRTITPSGRTVWQRADIDWALRRPDGLTNLEAARQGYAPLRAIGNTFEGVQMHHLNQDPAGALAEVFRSTHSSMSHNVPPPSWRVTDPVAAAAFRREVPVYWKWRAVQVGGY